MSRVQSRRSYSVPGALFARVAAHVKAVGVKSASAWVRQAIEAALDRVEPIDRLVVEIRAEKATTGIDLSAHELGSKLPAPPSKRTPRAPAKPPVPVSLPLVHSAPTRPVAVDPRPARGAKVPVSKGRVGGDW